MVSCDVDLIKQHQQATVSSADLAPAVAIAEDQVGAWILVVSGAVPAAHTLIQIQTDTTTMEIMVDLSTTCASGLHHRHHHHLHHLLQELPTQTPLQEAC